MDVIVNIKKHEKQWPGSSRRTRITGYCVGVHSMSAEHWDKRVEFVGRKRIDEALKRGDIALIHDEVEPEIELTEGDNE